METRGNFGSKLGVILATLMLRLNNYSGDENHPRIEDFKILVLILD